MSNAVQDYAAIAQFVCVAETGSFSAAARRLSLPKTSVSRRIARLEEELGTRLFHRSTRKVVLTTQGEQYLARVAPALADISAAHESVRLADGALAGTIRIGAPASLAEHLLIDEVIALLQSHAALSIELVLADGPIDLIGGRFDLAFQLAPSMPDSNLVARRLGSTRKVLVASPDLLARVGEPQTVLQLQDLPCLGLGDSVLRTKWRLIGPGEVEEVTIRARLAASSVDALLVAARASLGIALLPESMVSDDIANGLLVQALPNYTSETTVLFALLPSRRHLHPAVSKLLEAMPGLLRNRLSLPPRKDLVSGDAAGFE
ncbi:MAG: bacterial regulatory helix-turn-helix, lysR family protein [Devosia sp.]|nr:bacterial regulatory helix-turn-helix, lysR family protein [Devosia sp.]